MRMKKIYLWMMAVAMGMPAQAQVTLDKPVVKPATNITSSRFTANWEQLEGAEHYGLYVYVKQTVTEEGDYVIMDENFSGITEGSIIEPAGGDEDLVFLDEKRFSDYWGWWAYAMPTWIGGMIDGLIYSPYMDLRADGGKYKLIITTYNNDSDEIRVESNGDDGKVTKIYKAVVGDGSTGSSTNTVEFDNGCKGLFFSIINQTAELGTPDYLDRVQVVQHLKPGDAIYTQVYANEDLDAENDWGFAITSDVVSDLYYAYGETELYYDLQAVAYDWSAPRGSIPYTPVYSEFSDMVKVDLNTKTSVVTGIDGVRSQTVPASTGRSIYTLDGQRVNHVGKGVHIIRENGQTRKVFTK